VARKERLFMDKKKFFSFEDILTNQVCFDPSEVIGVEACLIRGAEGEMPEIYGLYVYLKCQIKLLVSEGLRCDVLDLHRHLASLIAHEQTANLYSICSRRDDNGVIQAIIVGQVVHTIAPKEPRKISRKKVSKKVVKKSHRGGKQTDHAG
jgi:hypothetical protein